MSDVSIWTQKKAVRASPRPLSPATARSLGEMKSDDNFNSRPPDSSAVSPQQIAILQAEGIVSGGRRATRKPGRSKNNNSVDGKEH